MNEKNRTVIFVILGCMIFAASILLGIEFNTRLDDPEFCGSCHEMQPFFNSYLHPDNGSILMTHKINCIQCHSNRKIYDAKNQVVIKIIASYFNLSSFFISKELKPDCSKCHSVPVTSMHRNIDPTNCTYCHWAHKPDEKSITSDNSLNNSFLSLISSGPHRNQTCLKCHGTSFQTPMCVNCHTGHGGQKLENRFCIVCHTDPHVPTKPGILLENTVDFPNDLPYSACQPCHENEYSNLTQSYSQHNDMQTCSICHVKHGMWKRCYQCHKAMDVEPHINNLKCSDCHTSGRLIQCQECHGQSHSWSGSTATVP